MVRVHRNMEPKSDNTIVIIPSYNESKTIGPIVKSVVDKGLKVLVIDDGSTDDTGRIARDNGAEVIYHEENLGKGFSVREGIEHILRTDRFKWVIIMDGDAQHHVEDIPVLMEGAQAGKADIVIGNRMLHAGAMPLVRYWTNKLMSWVISRICAQRIPDTQCGYRLIKTDALKNMKLSSEKFDIESEMLIQAAKNKMQIRSAPVQTIYGEETSAIDPIRDTFRFFGLILRHYIGSYTSAQMKESLLLFLKGIGIGVANIIPGVSGGTIAVILGIYDRLIEAIAEFFENPEKRKEYIFFIAKILTGAIFAILFLSRIMEFLLEHHFKETMFLFMGLVLGGIPAIVASHEDMRIRTSRILAFVLGMIVVLGISIIGKEYGKPLIPVPAGETASLQFQGYIMMLVAGFFAGGAMIVPGISGSFILVILGQYVTIINAIRYFHIKPLLVLAVGAAAGLAVFSKAIDICLKKMPSFTYYFILGLICASFYKIFPGIPVTIGQTIFCGMTFIAGAACSYALSKAAN